MRLFTRAILTFSLVGMASAWPAWLSLRAPKVDLLQRNQWCNGTDDHETDYWICISDCLYKFCIKNSECVKKCDAGCRDEYCHGGDPGPWKI
ncbi:hypothetical protein JX265_008204 [Neoarthrinium moseri]|uniref:Uncharacterized protein n=1 Tax=Neoarthrinium moseri TaxID=1658444 RepID=A0A9Q0AKB3_9PEZI|nr:uncharacterized protein JN550_004902 [Neoarthrinium moseri]KAI1865157.1 hypothetical protein JX265_008204 [Neoarthrinium moseri]KAI1870756.1 hypothetical protein JN550_004902 [Neoarthrinium moseri]